MPFGKKFTKLVRMWGRRPRPALSKTLKTEADEGVGRSPGGLPHIADFFNKLLGQTD
jgi:hypothetical protein